MMLIRGVKFHYAMDQSGLRNFDGSGYPYHRYLHWCGLTFNGCSFVAKTTTLLPRRGKEYGEGGNMPLLADRMTPAEFRPKCIHVSARSWLRGAALNAVGLSGPGVYALVQDRVWESWPEPFMISVMSVAGSMDDRINELTGICMIMAYHHPRSRFGIQLNMSCPNVEHAQEVDAVVEETRRSLAELRKLGEDIPLIVKINTLFPVDAAKKMADDPNCDGICNSNTLPWKDIPPADRMRMFGTTESPLAQFGGGGLSGGYLLPMVAKWVREARMHGITKPIIAGGGILKTKDVDTLAAAGASAIAVGSVAFLRPWRMQGIIDRANELGRGGKFYRS